MTIREEHFQNVLTFVTSVAEAKDLRKEMVQDMFRRFIQNLSKNVMHNTALSIFISLLLFGIIMMGCDTSNDKRLSGSGTLEATEVLVASKAVGEVLILNVQEGDTVKAGQAIAQVDTTKLALQKAQLLAGLQELHLNLINTRRSVGLAEEQFKNARKQYNRVMSLFKQGSASQQQLDTIETAYKAAQTKLENAETSLQILGAKQMQLKVQLDLINTQVNEARVVSPITGTVIAKYVERGELVGPGSPIVNIADLSRLWIKVYITETELGSVFLHAKAVVRPDAYPEESFEGTVTWVSPKAEFTPKNVQTKDARADLVYAVKVTVLNIDGKLLIGMPADVYFQP